MIEWNKEIASIYISINDDLPINWSTKSAYDHYIKHGIKENRLNPMELYIYFNNNSNEILEQLKNNKNICFTHYGGGGTEKYLKKNIQNKLIIRPITSNHTRNEFVIIMDDNIYIHMIDKYFFPTVELIKKNDIRCLLVKYDKLKELLQQYKGEIFINHLFHFNLNKIVNVIQDTKNENKNKITIILHDYYYINEIPQPIEKEFYISLDLNNANILKICDDIICPSYWVRDKYLKYIPDLNIKVEYHIDYNNLEINSYPPNNYKVLIYGELNKFKGRDILINLINNSSKLIFSVYGIHKIKEDICNNNVSLYGRYNDDDMIEIIKRENPAVILFTSIFGETFCYALKHAIQSGYPVICPNYGSFVELSKFINYKLLINPYELTEQIILDFMNTLPINCYNNDK